MARSEPKDKARIAGDWFVGLGLTLLTGAGEVSAQTEVLLGSFTGGSVTQVSETAASQTLFDASGLTSRFSNGSGSVVAQFGRMAAVENVPEAAGEPSTLVGDPGAEFVVSYADIALLANAVDPDGAALIYEVSASAGTLLVDEVETSLARMTTGTSVTWVTPSDATLESLFLNVVPIDTVVLSGAVIAVGLTSSSDASLEVVVGSSVVDSSTEVDFGDAEVASGVGVSETVTVTNTSSDGSSSSWVGSSGGEGFIRRLRPLQAEATVGRRLTISELSIDGADAGDFIVTGASFPLVLEPGESSSFTVTFLPGGFGDRVASIRLGQPGRPGFFGFGMRGRGNRPPTGGVDEVFRPVGLSPLKIRLSELLANDSDIDGDPVSFGGLSTLVSQRGRTLTVLDGEWLVYFPGEANEEPDDSFVYRVTDGRGATAPSVVWIRERASALQSGAIEASIRLAPNQPLRLQVRGIPGRRYRAQFTDSLNGPQTVWLDFGPEVTASLLDGAFEIQDPRPASASRFYRIVEVGP